MRQLSNIEIKDLNGNWTYNEQKRWQAEKNKEANGSNLSHIVANAKQNAALAPQPSHLRNAELKCVNVERT